MLRAMREKTPQPLNVLHFLFQLRYNPNPNDVPCSYNPTAYIDVLGSEEKSIFNVSLHSTYFILLPHSE